MSYIIIEVHQVYDDNKLSVIAVLWESNPPGSRGWVRASYFTTRPVAGYDFLLPNDQINADLIQRVAGQGVNLPDNLKEKFFPGKRKWEQ